ncbi:STY4199 family HEPN domain-containing protein [Enterobacter sp. Bisph1]|uniref:STY4199 family HEPN domain-containing protein n=1 Tax=Enterobacter sp. Bisph1 TaxID=1274399 RepID=UPI00057BF033|nr:STY4199 family HEPN domain-containing protein [Enterobacter sp. Bisph1]
MTLSAPLNTGEQFEKSIAIIRQASVEILLLLNVHFDEGNDPRWFLEQLDVARLSLGGWGAVAKRLKLNDAELTQFTLQLRHLQQLVPHYESGQNVTENQLIAALRFISALENLRQKQKLLTYNTVLPSNDAQQRHGLQQLRAMESMIKALVMQAWPDTERLRNHLKTQFGADRVRRWLRLGDRNDVLSGMRFSELALLLVDKKEFSQHYARLFNETSGLTMFVDTRKTLQTFLDDIRQIRLNVVAGKPLTSNELALLDSYYPQISGPVQRAYEEGRSSTNPDELLTQAGGELDAYWDQVRKKDRAGGGDALPIGESIDKPTTHHVRSREERDQMLSGALWSAVGVMVLLMVIGAFWMFTSGGAASVSRQAGVNVPIAEDREKPSPKEELSSMGLARDENNFRSAIDRNDTRVVSLFLRTGMSWKLSWTEKALVEEHNDVLDLLLRYRLQMDENRPCRRFISTLTHEMVSNNKQLTSITRDYLRAFCARQPVVERQRYDMEQAQRRFDAQPTDENRKWSDIQTAIYDVID